MYGVVGHTEHSRDRVEREQQISAPNRKQREEHRRQHASPVAPGDDLPLVVAIADRQCPAGQRDGEIVLNVRILIAVAEELDRGGDQRQAEDQRT